MDTYIAQLVGMFVMAHNDGATQREYHLYEELCLIADGMTEHSEEQVLDAQRALDSLDREGFLQDY